ESERVRRQLVAAAAEADSLRAQVDELANGADRRLREIKDAYSRGDEAFVLASAPELMERHRGSVQATEAEAMLDEVRAAQEMRAEEERREREAEERAKKAEEDRARREKERRLAQALSGMRSNYDEVRGIRWYYDKTTPYYSDNNKFHLYIGKQDQ